MNNAYAHHLRTQIMAAKLRAHRDRQRLDQLYAADSPKLLFLIGREVILRLHEPEFAKVARLICPTLRGRPGATLATALRAVVAAPESKAPADS